MLREAFGIWARRKRGLDQPPSASTLASGSLIKPSENVIELFRLLAAGTYLQKFTDEGKVYLRGSQRP